MADDDINVYFIIPKDFENENECEVEMLGTFELCKQYVKNCKWINENDYEEIPKSKQNVIVYQSFEGDVFKKLTTEKRVRIVGYRCLKTCLIEKIPIPHSESPVFCIPMVNLVICCSGIDPAEKKILQEKIGYMGGIYTPALTKQTTHLITNCVNSVKYAYAAELKIPVYTSQWVDAVWKTNLSSRYRADSSYFDEYKCPPFYKLNITSTGFDRKERDNLTQLVNENGGNYSGKFQSELTSVVICKGNKSEKYHAAKKSKIECCTIQWVHDSIKSGYALPFDKYRIMDKDYASSTLINQDQTVFEPNFSMVSTIQGDNGHQDISESRFSTFSANMSTLSTKNTPVKSKNLDTSKSAMSDKIQSLMKNFADLKEVKKAGPFLDGCCIYLAGFDLEHRDKLYKVLNLGGAIRYDEISRNVTHLIAPDYASSEIERFNQEDCYPIPLSLEWLVESFKLKAPAPEDLYILSRQVKKSDPPVTPNSPLSKKGVQMLRTNSSISINSEPLEKGGKDSESQKSCAEQPTDEDDFMKEYFGKRESDGPDTLEQFLIGKNFTNTKGYSKADTSEAKDKTEINQEPQPEASKLEKIPPPLPIEDSTTNITDINETSNIFQGLKFKVFGWDPECEEQINELATNAGGEIVSATNSHEKVDYVIVPQDFDLKRYKDNHVIVTNIWLEECLEENKLLEVKYYHKPIFVADSTSILTDCVICISNYKNFERTFVGWLIEYLGAKLEESLSRKNNRQGAEPATHLVSPVPLGSKYTAAKKWGIFIITHDWLLACAESGTKVPEHLYSLEDDSLEKSKNASSKEQTERTKLDSNIESARKKPRSELSTTKDKEGQKEETKKISIDEGDTYEHPMNELSTTNVSEVQKEKTKKSIDVDDTCEHPMENFFMSKPKLPKKRTNESTNVDSTHSKNYSTKTNETDDNQPIEIVDLDDNSDKDDGDNCQYTPISTKTKPSEIEKNVASVSKTPLVSKRLLSTTDSPIGLSQPMTPVAKFFENLGLPKGGTPDDSPLPMTPNQVTTPDTPLGRCFGNPNPSPETRKYWAKRINALPSYHHTPPLKRPRLSSTPLSVLKERLWKKILPKDYEENSQTDENDSTTEELKENTNVQTPKNPAITEHVNQLKEMLQKKSDDGENRKSLMRFEKHNIEMIEAQTPTKRNVIESQNDVIGWEDPIEAENLATSSTITSKEPSTLVVRCFMLSQIATSERRHYIDLIESLGGQISEQITLFDNSATHLICGTLTRNEKMLASIAAGKWILHTSYIEDSVKAGRFLNEELYEYGNPLATGLKDMQNNQIALAVYRWRKHINQTKQRAYHGMRAIIFANSRRDQFIRLVEAGGGKVVSVTEHNIKETDATHCFVEPKVLNEYPLCKILASKGVYCLPPIFLNNILVSNPPLNPEDYIIPELVPYFNKKA